MKKLTYETINSFKPCYEPSKYLPLNWEGSSVDLLRMEKIPAKDRLWVVVRHELLTYMQLKLYGLKVAQDCASNTTDARVNDCLKVVEKYLNGDATLKELQEARSAARSAAESAAEERQAQILIEILEKE